jgi:D-alanine-D-alanine ligase
MKKKKLRIGILFGGRSGEHEISLRSGASILQAIDRKQYDIVPLAISPQGQWLGPLEAERLLGPAAPAIIPAASKALQLQASADLIAHSTSLTSSLDLIFPVLHGTFGEDGTIQGLLELADIPYVGSGVLGSAAGMDKDIMKKLFAAAALPQTPYVTLLRTDWQADPRRAQRLIEKTLRYPLFVKPANLGSSVGISKVHNRAELAPAMDLAASFDRKLVIEQGVGGPGVKPRELEVAVLGNDTPEASVVGEIVPNKEFYDYESKYADSPEDPSIPIIPAAITAAQSKRIRAMAIQAFRACDCSGLARVDFLMDPTARGTASIYLNEINTMPGFTSISMYPKLWQATGIPYRTLIDRLITLALDRHAEKRATTFTR